MTALFIFVLGLCMGSFALASVWRVFQQSKGKKSAKYSISRGRSMCDSCKHQLTAKDLVPLLSWVSLRGKCRYCHKSIGWQHPAVELLTGGLFVLSYYRLAGNGSGWQVTLLVLWMAILTGLVALFVYDLKWMLLPNQIIRVVAVLAVAYAFVVGLQNNNLFHQLIMSVAGVLVGGGIFYFLYQISQGKWIGGGDVRLGAVLGVILGPLNSLGMIFIASCAGLAVTVPFLFNKKAKLDTKIPYGPFLIFGGVVMLLFGGAIFGWYKRQFLGL